MIFVQTPAAHSNLMAAALDPGDPKTDRRRSSCKCLPYTFHQFLIHVPFFFHSFHNFSRKNLRIPSSKMSVCTISGITFHFFLSLSLSLNWQYNFALCLGLDFWHLVHHIVDPSAS
jgi:hypothetical protein